MLGFAVYTDKGRTKTFATKEEADAYALKIDGKVFETFGEMDKKKLTEDFKVGVYRKSLKGEKKSPKYKKLEKVSVKDNPEEKKKNNPTVYKTMKYSK